MRRYIPALLLALAAFAPFTLGGCTDLINKLKGGGGDAGADAAEITALPEAGGTTAEAADAAAAPTPTLTTTSPTTTAVARPVTDAGTKTDAAVADAGKAADASATTDAGPAPAPTPTLKIPGLLDGGIPRLNLDGGMFKPWHK